ncbi:MAG: DAK2 domain-containing protein [Tepidiformaceae bacterium]
MSSFAPERELLDGHGLRDAFHAASRHLRESAKAVDAINVYPVPDGDTGSNMAATLREAVDAAGVLPSRPSIADVLNAIARGALYGARGNSGVILSQALRGFAMGVGEAGRFDAAALAGGLEMGSDAAYRAVSKPVEGTMLTVLREAGTGARAAAAALPNEGAGYPCAATLQAAIVAAEAAEANTPDLLPQLAEAGVTDAGGEGVCVILRGLLAAITGQAAPVPRMPERPIATRPEHEREEFGHCTEFVLEANGGLLDPERVRALVGSGRNRSVVVVGDEQAVRVHVHSDDPHALIGAVGALGKVSRAKVEDMASQNVRFGETGSGAGAGVAVLAMSHGRGFDQVFQSLGVAVAALGEVVKPPAGDIAGAADRLAKADVIVLANHKNVVMAAQQAASLARCTIHVVATQTLPQGIAAALAFDPEEPAATNVATMDRARADVRTVEVTLAAADRIADGVQARAGEPIALVDDRLIASAASIIEALVAGLDEAGAATGALVTLYGGRDLPAGELEALSGAVAERYPGVEVEAVAGGQPMYPVIASVEA